MIVIMPRCTRFRGPRLRVRFAARVAVAATLAALAVSFGGPARAAPSDNSISCMMPVWPGFAPVYLANQLGYFQQEGLTVTEKFDDDRTDALAAFTNGSINCYLRTVGEYQGRPFSPDAVGTIIGTIDMSLGGDGVAAGGDIKTPADLRGKVVASEPNIPARLILQAALKRYHLTFHDLTIKEISTADALAVFTDPHVAAVAAFEPELSAAVEKSGRPGAHILVSSRDYPGIILDTIIARNADLAANPEKYRKLLRGIYRAIDYIGQHHDRAVAIMARHFKMTPAEFESVLKNLKYTPYEEALSYMGTPGQPGKIYGIFSEVMELNLENGASDVRLDANKQIDNRLIPNLFQGHAR
jgi:NitT/TauT family transport system substrate-binding protein